MEKKDRQELLKTRMYDSFLNFSNSDRPQVAIGHLHDSIHKWCNILFGEVISVNGENDERTQRN